MSTMKRDRLGRTGSDCRAHRSIAAGELVEERAIETARGTVIDILDDGVVAQPGVAQAGGEALVAAMVDLAINQKPKPVRMGKRGALAGGFEFGEGLGHAGQPEWAS